MKLIWQGSLEVRDMGDNLARNDPPRNEYRLNLREVARDSRACGKFPGICGGSLCRPSFSLLLMVSQTRDRHFYFSEVLALTRRLHDEKNRFTHYRAGRAARHGWPILGANCYWPDYRYRERR